MLACFAALSILCILLPESVQPFVTIPVNLIGVMAVWGLYDIITPKKFALSKHKFLGLACQFTFFIYLYHEPTLNILRKLLIIPLGRTSAGFAINYLVSPWVFVLLMIPVGMLLRKYLHAFYELLVGGR